MKYIGWKKLAGTRKNSSRTQTFIQDLLFESSAGVLYRGIRHTITGGVGTLLYIGSITFLVEIIEIYPVSATIISFVLLMVFTYTLQRIWVYNTVKGHLHTLPRYLTVAAISFLLNVSIMFIVVELLNSWYVYGIMCSVVIVPITNFILNYYWTYR